MQPQLCSRCKKNIAVVFITRQENGQNVNEGLCLKCAKNLGLPQVDEMMRRMGITDEDLDNISNEMMGAFGGAENLEGLTDADDPDADNEDEDGKTATFPFLSRFFGGNPAANDAQNGNEAEQTQSPRSNKKVEKGSKHKFLDSYCINLSQRARDGKLDAVVGREEEIERVIQILNRRQKNNPCLIGEPGVGKTAIAEGLAQRIVAGDVPFKLRSKEVYLLDLTALVAGTQFRGQFESRMKGLIEEIRKMGNVILVIDEVHNIVGCGRTDAGVHAERYIANFHTESRIPVERLPFAINTHTPEDIVVREALEVADDFNAILSCQKKEYTYRIYNSRIKNPFYVNRAYFYPKHLDEEVMDRAARAFEGTHDFRAVRSVGTETKTTVRTVHYCRVSRSGDLLELKVCADGFLYNMVRAITGTVLYAAEGKLTPEDIPEILASGDRSLAGPTVPPGGLYMTRLWYEDERLNE